VDLSFPFPPSFSFFLTFESRDKYQKSRANKQTRVELYFRIAHFSACCRRVTAADLHGDWLLRPDSPDQTLLAALGVLRLHRLLSRST
jgi:hypothetical protein